MKALSQRLDQDPDQDYVLDGNSCWIEVGDKVMYIRKSNGRCIIEVMENDRLYTLVDTFSFGI